MDAATEFVYVDLTVEQAGEQAPRVLDRLSALPGEGAADAIEIELDAEQMDALLDGSLDAPVGKLQRRP